MKGKRGKPSPDKTPSHDEIRAQMQRLYNCGRFRGRKLRRLLDFLITEWLADGGDKLTLRYIAESLQDEPLTFEDDSSK